MSLVGGMALNLAGNAANQAISQWINYGFQKKLMGKQFMYNEKAAENAYQRQLDFWDMQNKYDDPGSQMLRLREAGLNPGLMNGQLGNTSNNLSSVSSSSVGVPPSGPAPGKFDVMQIMLQDENIKNLAADTALKRENAENVRLQNVMDAIRANDFEAYYQLTKDEKIAGKNLSAAQEEYYRNQAKVAFQEARLKELDANQLDEFTSTGGNTYKDNSSLTGSQTGLNIANTNLAGEQATSEQYKREFYTAGSANQRSMAAKNYAESRLIDVKTDIESVFGALQAEATLSKTEAEAQVVIPLANSLIALQDSVELLNKDNVRHNKVVENIQKEANQINLALMKIKENEFYHSMFTDFVDRMVPDVNKLLGAIANML